MNVFSDKKKRICDAILASGAKSYKTRNTIRPNKAYKSYKRGFMKTKYPVDHTPMAEIRVRLGLDRELADEIYNVMKQNADKKSLAGVPIQASYVTIDGQKERCWFSIGPSGKGYEAVKLKFPKPTELDQGIDHMVKNVGKIVSNGIVGYSV